MTQLSLSSRNNNLFSEHYLEHLLKNESEWKISEEILKGKFEEIKEIYESKKEILANMIESELEDKFIRPILKILGHNFIVPSGMETIEGTKRPDYAFFGNENDKNSAYKNKDNKEEFYKKCIAIGEAKKWEKDLDKRERLEMYDNDNPTWQIDFYLRNANVKWGILTNGRNWRIYCKEKFNSYYEIDLVNLIEKGNLEDFKYFYLFFSVNAFPKFLDKVHNESIEYAKKVGEELKVNVHDALKILTEGFLNFKENKLAEKDIEIIRENSFIFLYRLLFCLYAENKRFMESYLLPINVNKYYENYSLSKIKKEIAERDKDTILHNETKYWESLTKLFNLVNEGTNEEFFFPSYNGGLFNPNKHKFLANNKIGDKYIADVIYLLTVAKENGNSKKGFIDYSPLEIRHLGSIYEGLLEYNLEVAKEDLAIIKEKGKEIYVSLEKAKAEKMKFSEIVKKGEVYPITDKGERKATGSYYTPDYIVKYIVENTLKPIVEEKCRIAKENRESESKEILKIKVLDPAMGSGHFLVETVEFLAKELRDAIDRDLEKDLVISIEDAKREIVSNCIYGVDLNELAVELAKVSLWLSTVAKDKPLSFLEHRLKCGNSLIGAKLEDLNFHPNTKKKRKLDEKDTKIESIISKPHRKKLADRINELSKIKEEKLEDIKEKEKKYEELKNSLEYKSIKTLSDVYTSIYFGNNVLEETYNKFTDEVLSKFFNENKFNEIEGRGWVKFAEDKTNEKKFFHWELEFPDVFFENGGFDCVIGNPPYDVIMEDRLEEKEYILNIYSEIISGRTNLYALFIAKSNGLLKQNGLFRFIIPATYLSDSYFEKLRNFIRLNFSILEIVRIEQRKGVFEGVLQATSILGLIKDNSGSQKFPAKVKWAVLGKDIADGKFFESLLPPQIIFLPLGKKSVIPTSPYTQSYSIIIKMRKNSITLKDISSGAITGSIQWDLYKDKLIDRQKKGSIRMLWAEEVQRYMRKSPEMRKDKEWILLDRMPDSDKPFLAIQRTTAIEQPRRIIATLIDREHLPCFVENHVNYVLNISNSLYNILYPLSLLNSQLFDFYFRIINNNTQVSSGEINQLPIPLISFSTPKNQREKLLQNAKQIYEKELAKSLTV